MKLLSAQKLAFTIGVHKATIARWRKAGRLEQGVHYFKLNPTTILYNVALVEDWIVNQHQPHLHEQAIENFLASLPSNDRPQRKKANKKAARTAKEI